MEWISTALFRNGVFTRARLIAVICKPAHRIEIESDLESRRTALPAAVKCHCLENHSKTLPYSPARALIVHYDGWRLSLTEKWRADGFTSEDQIVAALLSANVEEQFAQCYAKHARPCVWLKTESVTDEAEIAIGTTKIGGQPDLPAGLAWPPRPPYPPGERAARYRAEIANPKSWSWATPEQHEEFRRDYAQMLDVIEKPFPLTFIAQINLAEAWHAGPFTTRLRPLGASI